MFNFSKKTKKMALAFTAGLLVIGMIAGCGSSNSGDNAKKVLRIGAETTFPPFEFTDDKGNYIGFDLDLTKAIAEKISYQYEFKSLGFDALIPALKAGDIDVIASGINPTPERAKQVIFSEPYFTEGGFATLVLKNNDTIQNNNDLSGKAVVTQIGTVSTDIAKAIPNTTVKEVNANSQIFMELQAGTAQAAILDNAVALYYLNNGANKDFKIVGTPVQPEPYVMAFRPNDKELQETVNKALTEMKADGSYNKIYTKWFGARK